MRRIVLAASLLAAFLCAPAAQAAFPGANGKIAFVRETGSGEAIFTMNPDGSGLTQLTSNANGDFDPAWSADGARIAFTRVTAADGSTSQVWGMNADGSGQAQLTSGNGDCEPYFLPDGRIVFIRGAPSFCRGDGGAVFRRDLDGTETALTTPPAQQSDANPTSSPNGQTIAFARGNFGDSVIFTVPSSGGAATALTSAGHTVNTPLLDASPNYSPEGATVAFERCPGGEGCAFDAPKNIFTIPAGGGTIAQLTSSSSGSDPDNCGPAYAPDGTRLVFARLLSNTGFPLTCDPGNADTENLAFIGSGGGAVQASLPGFLPDWQPVAVPESQTGAGSNAPTGICFRAKITIFGTNGNDRIVGTSGNDVIHGFRGTDKINGKGGHDILCGGRGRDRIFGKHGDDILIGGKQSDYLNGGPGQNRIFGGTPGAPQQEFHNVCIQGQDDKLTNCQEIK